MLDKPPVCNPERRRVCTVALRYILFVRSPAVLSLLEADGHLSQRYQIIFQRYRMITAYGTDIAVVLNPVLYRAVWHKHFGPNLACLDESFA